MNSAKRRSVYLINNKLQLTILLYGVSLALFGNLIVSMFAILNDGRYHFLSPSGMYIFSSTLAFLLCLLLVLLGLGVSNRIAGPIHNLKNHIEGVLENKTQEPLKFRKDDYFIEIVEPYNDLIKKIK